jgi:NTE family protein
MDAFRTAMERKRIAIACQGGGSQCAFVAGALQTLFEREVQQRFQIVGFSGTSGGALTAAVGWFGLLKQIRGDRTSIAQRIGALWADLTAQSPQEIMLDAFCTQWVRWVEQGLLPSVATSPSSPRFRFGTELTARLLGRPEFTDLRVLLDKHLDFKSLPSLLDPDSPVLLVGAGDVIEGEFKVFSSACDEIKAEALLASAAVPNLFPAVWVDGHAYWDGIFASNPPVMGFLQRRLMGTHPVPDEIWIIQVNRTKAESVPETPSEISDRRNHLAGNLSLGHELRFIETVNMLLQENALTERFRARFGLENTETIAVRFIRMSLELQRSLDYPSKLSRQPTHIARLKADGVAQTQRFLAELAAANGTDQVERESPAVETH